MGMSLSRRPTSWGGELAFHQAERRMSNHVVHRTRDGTIQRLGETNGGAGRGNETIVDRSLAVCFHELAETTQGSLDEIAVVGDSLAIQHGGVERLRAGQQDVLRAGGNEQMSRPVRKRALGK